MTSKKKSKKQEIEELQLEEAKDHFGDTYWMVKGKKYYFRHEAMKAISELMEEEYRQRALSESSTKKTIKTRTMPFGAIKSNLYKGEEDE